MYELGASPANMWYKPDSLTAGRVTWKRGTVSIFQLRWGCLSEGVSHRFSHPPSLIMGSMTNPVRAVGRRQIDWRWRGPRDRVRHLYRNNLCCRRAISYLMRQTTHPADANGRTDHAVTKHVPTRSVFFTMCDLGSGRTGQVGWWSLGVGTKRITLNRCHMM